jgi:dihydropteroate synthase
MLRVRVGERTLTFEQPLIMGVVNVTPDSFSAGHTLVAEAAIAHGVTLWKQGAAILDIGGEATNPRAAAIDAELELARVLPVIAGLARATDAILSIDTTKAEVAERAVAAGALIVNDVSGGRFDPAMLDTVAALVRRYGAAYVAGHLRGGSLAEVFAAERGDPTGPTWREVVAELAAQVGALPEVMRDACLVDPGLGFGKGAGELNFELLVRGHELVRQTGRPVLVGPSRKRFLRSLAPAAASVAASMSASIDASVPGDPPARLPGDPPARPGGSEASDPAGDPLAWLDAATVGACLAAVRGGAQVVRVHNVALLRPALAVYIRE